MMKEIGYLFGFFVFGALMFQLGSMSQSVKEPISQAIEQEKLNAQGIEQSMYLT